MNAAAGKSGARREGSDPISEAADIGIIGLGVMGRNLALNFALRERRVLVYDPWPEARRGFAANGERTSAGPRLCGDLETFVAGLARPRAVLLLVKAGEPVDRQVEALVPLLEAGDLIVDAGNSHFRDSVRRGALLEARGLRFLGLGLSGGETGARTGPCLMAGGGVAAYRQVERLLVGIAAKVEGEPCCAHMGGDGAGHFVKMLHNGIEYAVMQLIAEAYWVLRELAGLEPEAIAGHFARWNRGELASYLVGITGDVLATRDAPTGEPMVDVILDRAGEKGTGRWASAAALELGVPAPTLMAAVAARAVSALKEERETAGRCLKGPSGEPSPRDADALIEGLEQALLASIVCAYAQGFAVMAAAARDEAWQLDLGRTALIWRGGSILRAGLLEPIAAAFAADPGLANLMLAPDLRDMLGRCQDGWRSSVALALSRGVPAPGLASALTYYDAYRSGRLWADLIQAQRDYFGAHGFARVDRPGSFHGDWRRDEEGGCGA